MHWISALQVVNFMPPRQFHAKEQFLNSGTSNIRKKAQKNAVFSDLHSLPQTAINVFR